MNKPSIKIIKEVVCKYKISYYQEEDSWSHKCGMSR